jgi:DNA-binding SARP family transcriptional activator/class 3 adenylate cyclase
MEFRILGALEVVEGDRTLPLGGAQRKALLAMLLLGANRVVGIDELVEGMWGDDPPKTAEHSIQVHVSELRKVLESGDADGRATIARRSLGYVIELPEQALDLDRFERLAERGRAALEAGDPTDAARILGDALDLWRGPALADFVYDDFAQTPIERLESLRLAAIEDRIEADLALGRDGELVPELQQLVAANPLRERLRGQLMLALYRSDRQAEALQEFHRARTLLADELGIDPGRPLSDLAAAILAQDPSLAPAPPPRPSEVWAPVESPNGAGERGLSEIPVSREIAARKIVSLVLTDLAITGADGAAADPEASASVMGRAAELVRSRLRRHGATVHETAGDAVVGVFGIPRIHEDDALRAVRAAVEVRDALGELNAELARDRPIRVRARTGVHTGEVLADAGGDDRPPGDAIQRARQLAARADDSQIVIAGATFALVRDAVDVDSAEDPSDGQPDRVLLAVRAGAMGLARRIDSPIVGRDDELAALDEFLDRVVRERTCQLLTVYGDAGIGKSRLVDEFARRTGSARILKGRCLAYGDGITYWPIAEAVKEAADVHDADASADVRRKLEALLEGVDDRDRIVEGIAQMLGLSDVELSQGETLWATRRLLEALAEERPVVLLVEDIHWAEPTLLDLLESVADWSRESPLLLLCTARPEIFEGRSGWGGGRPNAATIALRPLSAVDTGKLIENLVHHPGLDAESKSRITEAAEGNPLFVEQLLSMLIDEGLLQQDGGSWSLATDLSKVALPTSMQTLLSARLDRLPEKERSVLGVASVIGRVFDDETLEALMPQDVRDAVPAALHELVRKDLVRPERGPQGEGFRFRHVLILNATYESLPKRVRAQLHESVADRMDADAGEQAAGYDEIVGHHLERAAHYLSELGPADDHVRALRTRAGRRLASAGSRAAARGDMPAAVSLHTLAASLLPKDDAERLAFLPELGTALVEIGRMGEADDVFAEAIEAGTDRKDLGLVGDALMYRFEEQVWSGRWDDAAASVEFATALLRDAEAAGHVVAQQRVWTILGMWDPSSAKQHEYTERALELAVRADDSRGIRENIQMLCGLLATGPTPVDVGLARTAEFQRMTAGDRVMQAAIVVDGSANLLAMADRMDEARNEYQQARSTFRELGLDLWLGASGTIGPVTAELTAGDPAIAETMLRDGIARLERMSEQGSWLMNNYWLLVRTLLRLDRLEEAAKTFARLRALTDERSTWYGTVSLAHGELLVHQGRPQEAVTEIRPAVADTDADWRWRFGEGLAILADALRAAGNEDEARTTAQEALAVFEKKGDIASAKRTRVFLDGSDGFWDQKDGR